MGVAANVEEQIHRMISSMDRVGSTLTLSARSAGAYTPAAGQATPGTPVTVTVRGVLIGPLSSADLDDKADGVVLLSARDTSNNTYTAPEQRDRLTGLGDTMVITRVKTYYIDGTAVAHKCMVSR